MASNKAILFDIPTRGESHCWSLNAWKGRLCLNFKGIPYETRWIEYPDIAPHFESLGIPPNEGSPPYTVPAVQLSKGRYVMESAKIAEALEAEQPTPSLQLGSPLVKRTQEAVQLINDALARISRPRVAEELLNLSSAEYFRRTRAKRFGVPWEQVALKGEAIETAWENATTGIIRLREVLAEDDAGPFVMGAAPGFADFVLAGFWRFMQMLDHEGDLYERLIKQDPSFSKQYAACEQWLKRDD